MLDAGCTLGHFLPGLTVAERTTWRSTTRADSTASPRPASISPCPSGATIHPCWCHTHSWKRWMCVEQSCRQDFLVHGPYCPPQSSPRLLICSLFANCLFPLVNSPNMSMEEEGTFIPDSTNSALANLLSVAALVIDNGSGMCKAGFAGDDAPRAVFP